MHSPKLLAFIACVTAAIGVHASSAGGGSASPPSVAARRSLAVSNIPSYSIVVIGADSSGGSISDDGDYIGTFFRPSGSVGIGAAYSLIGGSPLLLFQTSSAENLLFLGLESGSSVFVSNLGNVYTTSGDKISTGSSSFDVNGSGDSLTYGASTSGRTYTNTLPPTTWTPWGAPTDILLTMSRNGSNAIDEVVGSATLFYGVTLPFTGLPVGATPIALTAPSNINNSGTITGVYQDPTSGIPQAAYVTATEPSTPIVMNSGLNGYLGLINDSNIALGAINSDQVVFDLNTGDMVDLTATYAPEFTGSSTLTSLNAIAECGTILATVTTNGAGAIGGVPVISLYTLVAFIPTDGSCSQ